MLHGEYLAILLGSGTVRPETRIDVTNCRGRVTKDDHGGTIMIIDQGPNV